MPIKTYRQAINEAMAQEMRRDSTVIVIGEDVAGGAGCDGERDAYGGVMGVTKGLFPEFGERRVIDTPITESAIMGAAAGAAQTGLRPIAELMFMDLWWPDFTRESLEKAIDAFRRRDRRFGGLGA